ncbi:putative methyltransferase NSUN7 [Pholidichthys leucotaenia]
MEVHFTEQARARELRVKRLVVLDMPELPEPEQRWSEPELSETNTGGEVAQQELAPPLEARRADGPGEEQQPQDMVTAQQSTNTDSTGCSGEESRSVSGPDKGDGECPEEQQQLQDMIESSKGITPQDECADSGTPAAPLEPQITGHTWQGFPDRVYLLAAILFQNNHLVKHPAYRLVNYGAKRGIPLPGVKDAGMQHAAYELAFNTLKYQELLEDIMIDSYFHISQPVPEDRMGLVAVMLYDFQDRRFVPRENKREDEIIQEVRDVENYLLRFKTNLAASLARCRIKRDFVSIDCVLPEIVRKKQERSSSLPVYAWVNTLKSSLNDVQGALKSAGFSEVKSIGELEGQTFCRDPHCGDILVFPVQLKAQLCSTKLLRDHKLVIQDKSCSLGPNAVCTLLPEGGDVLMVGSLSGFTISHTASLIAEKHKGNSNMQSIVYACVSDCTDAQRKELQLTISTMACKNVKLIPEVFQALNRGEKWLQNVRVILLTPKCSVSAVCNPVEFILQENGDTGLLQDLSQGSIAQSKLESLVAQQRKDIDYALTFPKVCVVVYSTCSCYPEENVDVVNRALQQAKVCSDQKGEPKQANYRLNPSPFSSSDQAEISEEADAFFTLEPSEHSNGCFLAVLKREPEPVVNETPQELIARANGQGVPDRIGCKQNATRMKKRNTEHQLSVSGQPKSHQTKGGSSSSILCGHEEFTNTWQSSQGTADHSCAISQLETE